MILGSSKRNSTISETIFNIAKLTEEIRQKEAEINEPSFWDQNKEAQHIFSALSSLKKKKETYDTLCRESEELSLLVELMKEAEDEAYIESEWDALFPKFKGDIESLELASLLSGEYDHEDCYLSINAGAGGTDAQDWAEMLQRMILRWCESHGYKTDIIECTMGDEAGIKSVTIEVTGDLAYGYLKTENGVHRLVRLSPFNANSKRQTSFAAFDVIPKLKDDSTQIEIDPKDLRIDTFRASGAGGQHINKTDSAVRITHIPTGLVATSQNSRSQIDNRATALAILKARIVTLMQQEHKDKIEELRGTVTDIGFGNQIRSYVFHPYKLVKDLRTQVETSNVEAVMDGKIDEFIKAALIQKV